MAITAPTKFPALCSQGTWHFPLYITYVWWAAWSYFQNMSDSFLWPQAQSDSRQLANWVREGWKQSKHALSCMLEPHPSLPFKRHNCKSGSQQPWSQAQVPHAAARLRSRTALTGFLTYPPSSCGDGFHCGAVEPRPANGLTSLEPLQILSCTLGSFWERGGDLDDEQWVIDLLWGE